MVNSSHHQPSDHQNISFCVQQEKQMNKYRFGTTCGSVNDDIFFIGWTVPLILRRFKSLRNSNFYSLDLLLCVVKRVRRSDSNHRTLWQLQTALRMRVIALLMFRRSIATLMFIYSTILSHGVIQEFLIPVNLRKQSACLRWRIQMERVMRTRNKLKADAVCVCVCVSKTDKLL